MPPAEPPDREPPENEPLTRTTPSWWDLTRRVLTFFTGMGSVLYALITVGNNLGVLICGLVLMGVLPVEDWMRLRR